jgi:hypothetical protein
MDLNKLYSQNQISLLRAKFAKSDSARRRYVAQAGSSARRIRDLQTKWGATAAPSWRTASQLPERFSAADAGKAS